LSLVHLALGEFGLLELCSLTLFKFRVNVLLTKRKLNSPPPPLLGHQSLQRAAADPW
jgi:hypothetical protein